MADDIFLTPDEQDERARKWLKENGPALAIGIALGLGAIFGWNQYKDSIQKKAEQASAVYTQAIDAVKGSDLPDIDAQLSELKEQHAKSPYAAKVALLKAKQLSLSDLPAAFTELQWVVDNAREFGVQHTARIRQAKIKLALGELDSAKALASHTPMQGFDSNYAELLGDIALAEGDQATAKIQYQTAIDTLPDSLAGYGQVLTIKLNRVSAGSVSESGDAVKSEDATSVEAKQAPVEFEGMPAKADETPVDAKEAPAKVERAVEQKIEQAIDQEVEPAVAPESE